MSFLPKDYQEQVKKIPKSQGDYFKIQDGQRLKIRILGPEPVVDGWSYWGKDDKPHISRDVPDKEEFAKLARPNEQIKFFLVFIVWNHTDKKVQIWQVTQKTIRAQLEALIENESWGDPYPYDITVSRKGKELDTEYHLLPSPGSKTFVPPPGWEAINLEALFSGGNPFEDFTQPNTNTNLSSTEEKPPF